MTTYYIDPANGNDASDGLGWGTAWKTLLNGATFARMGQTDSDEVRIAKSPDPVSIGNVTWTNDSATISFPTCSNITVDNCNSGWTAGLVTPTYSTTTYREGTASLQAVLASSNGTICRRILTSADYSAHTRLTFWINFNTAVNYTAGSPIRIRLCSDTAGTVMVAEFTVPSYYYPAAYWVPITVSPSAGSMAAATAIQSIVIATTSAVSNTIRFDNFSVAKAASDATSLVLTDLIAKDDGLGAYYPPTAIDGTTIKMTVVTSAIATAPVASDTNYYSLDYTTATVASVKRECFSTAITNPATSTATAVGAINYTNQANWPETKTYLGGWNTATDLVDGETWFDGATGYGYGLTQTNSPTSSWSVDRLSAVRYQRGWIMQLGANVNVTKSNIVACIATYEYIDAVTGIYPDINYTGTSVSFDWMLSTSANTPPVWTVTSDTLFTADTHLTPIFNMTVANAHTPMQSTTGGIYVRHGNFTSTGTLLTTNSAITIGVNGLTTLNNVVAISTNGGIITMTGPGQYTVNNPLVVRINGLVRLVKATTGPLISTPPAGALIHVIAGTPGTSRYEANITPYISSNGAAPGVRPEVYVKDMLITTNGVASEGFGFQWTCPFYRFDNVNNSGEYRMYNATNNNAAGSKATCYWVYDTTNSYSGAGSWQRRTGADANGTTGGSWDRIPLAEVPVKAGTLATISLRIKRSAGSTGNQGALVVMGNGIHTPQVSTALSSTGATNIDTWEQVSVSFTPTANSIVSVRAAYRDVTFVNNSRCYFDDLQVTQA